MVAIIFLLVYMDYIHDWFLVVVYIVAYCYYSLKAVSYFYYKCVENVVGLHK
jgi:hypothetical protein